MTRPSPRPPRVDAVVPTTDGLLIVENAPRPLLGDTSTAATERAAPRQPALLATFLDRPLPPDYYLG